MEGKLNTARCELETILADMESTCRFVRKAVEELKIDTDDEETVAEEEEDDQGDSKWLSYFRQ